MQQLEALLPEKENINISLYVHNFPTTIKEDARLSSTSHSSTIPETNDLVKVHQNAYVNQWHVRLASNKSYTYIYLLWKARVPVGIFWNAIWAL